MNWLRSLWVNVRLAEISLDLCDALCLDILNVHVGSEKRGFIFHGSLLMLYWEPGYSYMGNPPHFAWDVLYLRQWFDPKDRVG